MEGGDNQLPPMEDDRIVEVELLQSQIQMDEFTSTPPVTIMGTNAMFAAFPPPGPVELPVISSVYSIHGPIDEETVASSSSDVREVHQDHEEKVEDKLRVLIPMMPVLRVSNVMIDEEGKYVFPPPSETLCVEVEILAGDNQAQSDDHQLIGTATIEVPSNATAVDETSQDEVNMNLQRLYGSVGGGFEIQGEQQFSGNLDSTTATEDIPFNEPPSPPSQTSPPPPGFEAITANYEMQQAEHAPEEEFIPDPQESDVIQNTELEIAVSPDNPSSSASIEADTSVVPMPPSSPSLQGDQKSESQRSSVTGVSSAVSYLNRIKDRFQTNPEKYYEFLNLVRTHHKNRIGDYLTTLENRVTVLFEGHPDLLQDFYAFGYEGGGGEHLQSSHGIMDDITPPLEQATSECQSATISGKKRMASCSPGTPSKRKAKIPRRLKSTQHPVKPFTFPIKRKEKETLQNDKKSVNVPKTKPIKPKRKYTSSKKKEKEIAEAPVAKEKRREEEQDKPRGGLEDNELFQELHKLLDPVGQYKRFCQVVELYVRKTISLTESAKLINEKFPVKLRLQLHNWFKRFVQFHDEIQKDNENATEDDEIDEEEGTEGSKEQLATDKKKLLEWDDPDFDLTDCKRTGASYYFIKGVLLQKKCSGRTDLCKEVLNDDWKAGLEWKEDYGSNFASNKAAKIIQQYDDDRYENDMVMEGLNRSIAHLEVTRSQLAEKKKGKLCKLKDIELIGFERTILTFYGETVGPHILNYLKCRPENAVPVVLERLKEMALKVRADHKLREKEWREDLRRIHFKSMDYQTSQFKINDVKDLSRQSIISELEFSHDELLQVESVLGSDEKPECHHFAYPSKSIMKDACNLLFYQVRRFEDASSKERKKMKRILKEFIPKFFSYPGEDLSVDEDDGEEFSQNVVGVGVESGWSEVDDSTLEKYILKHENQNESYRLFFVNSNWFVFLRLQQILCERFAKLFDTMNGRLLNDAEYRQGLKESPAFAMGYISEPEMKTEDYYNHFLEIVRERLDGIIGQTDYEDQLREMFRGEGYVASTMNKLVSNAVGELYKLVTDETSHKCKEAYLQAIKYDGAGGRCSTAAMRVRQEILYRQQSSDMMKAAKDHCVKVVLFENCCQMTMTLLDRNIPATNCLQISEKDKNHQECEPYTGKRSVTASLLDTEEEQSPPPLRHSRFLARNPQKLLNSNAEYDSLKKRLSNTHLFWNESVQGTVEHTPDINILIVWDGEDYFYRGGSFSSAKKHHRSLSLNKWARFKRFHEDWLLKNISTKDKAKCEAWLKKNPVSKAGRRKQNSLTMKIDSVGGEDRVPYHQYNKYVIVAVQKKQGK